MKKLKVISLITLFILFLVRCSDDKTTTVTETLGDLSGIVTYTNTSNASVPAVGATVVLMTGTSQVRTTETDAAGMYKFPNLEAGAYLLSASFYAVPTNTGGRLDGLNFAPAADVAVTMSSTDITNGDIVLVSTGQSGTDLEAVDLNYTWDNTGSAYVNANVWKYDGTHSPVTFEFPYRGTEADFLGGFGQLGKVLINFDPANPATGTIDVEVDMLSVNTRAAGGRDPMIQNGTGELGTPNSYQFSPQTIISVMGCISGTFGITADGALPSLIVNDNGDRYAKFVVTAGNISKHGDGYVAKGNITWRGFTVATEMWFKMIPKWLDAPAPGNGTPNGRTYTGFEGKFLMDPYNRFNIRSGSVNQAIIRINVSVVCYKV